MPERLDCSSRTTIVCRPHPSSTACFHGEIDAYPDGICREIENLDQWEDSTGRSLPGLPIVVEVTRNGTQVVFAMITKDRTPMKRASAAIESS